MADAAGDSDDEADYTKMDLVNIFAIFHLTQIMSEPCIQEPIEIKQ